MRFKWYSLNKESHSRELKIKQQRVKGCEARSNSLTDSTLIVKIRASLQQREKFSAQYRAANISDKIVILNVRTQWNSIFDMLVKANELKEVNLFLFTLYIIFIIIKIKNLFFFLFLSF